MLIRPVLTYAPAIWGGTCDSNILKLQRIQNRVLKIITNAPMYTEIDRIHKDLNVEYLDEHIKTLSKSFYERCHYSKYKLISGLGTYVHIPENKKKREKRPNYFLIKNN